jgi:hypothetical protein
VDIVLGVSMAPDTVRIVLVEGEGAGGVTVDQGEFAVPPGAAAVATADQVIDAILGTREGAAESGYQLLSTRVTWTDQSEADALRNALAARQIENVTLVSAFTAAAALAQAVGSATNYDRTALLFVEPASATLAVVDSSDGSIADVHRKPLPNGDDAALAELTAMVAGVESMSARPNGVFLVGSGADIPLIKRAVGAATSLSVTAPEEPELALARGAALASSNAQLGAPSTVVIPHVEDPARELAYSAEPDDESDLAVGDYREYTADRGERRSRKLLAIVSVTVIFVGGVVALTVALAVGIRPHVDQRPSVSKNVVAQVTPAPPPKAQVAAPPPPSAAPTTQPAAPPQAAPSAAPAPAPSQTPVQRWLPLLPRDGDYGDGDWRRRRLGRGILIP